MKRLWMCQNDSSDDESDDDAVQSSVPTTVPAQASHVARLVVPGPDGSSLIDTTVERRIFLTAKESTK